MVFGALAIASLAGMVVAFFSRFFKGIGDIIKIISNIVVAAVILLLAFSPIFPVLTLEMLTVNIWLAILVFVGLGYAGASLITDLIGL